MALTCGCQTKAILFCDNAASLLFVCFLLQKAEKDGFSAEELNIASVLAIDDVEGPIHWLHTTWYDLIHKVMLEVAIPENSQEIGNVSPEEAREALIECTGEVSRATTKCMEIRKKKVRA